jgi:RNA-directed DNA polymerase
MGTRYSPTNSLGDPKTGGRSKLCRMVGRKLLTAIHRRSYRPPPVRRVYIPKPGKDELKPIGVPTIIDRCIQRSTAKVLESIWEQDFLPCSYGGRPNRSALQAISTMQRVIAEGKISWVYEADLKNFFGSLDHSWLMKFVRHRISDERILLLITRWLKAGVMEDGVLAASTIGTPQGGSISPSLLNLTMRGFEAEIKKATGSRDLVNVVVYADDFIVSARSKEILKAKVKPAISKFLSERRLTLLEEKTLITHIDQGFDFLGFNVRRDEDKLLIKPAKKSVKSFLENFRDRVASNQTAKTENLINILNPRIMGWANYYRSVISKKTFSYVEHQILWCLWRWAKRRHPGQSKSWVWSKYFRCSFKTKNVLKTRTPLGELALLAKAASVPIVRHIKIKSDANPFDPNYQEYSSKLKTARKLERQTVLETHV